MGIFIVIPLEEVCNGMTQC